MPNPVGLLFKMLFINTIFPSFLVKRVRNDLLYFVFGISWKCQSVHFELASLSKVNKWLFFIYPALAISSLWCKEWWWTVQEVCHPLTFDPTHKSLSSEVLALVGARFQCSGQHRLWTLTEVVEISPLVDRVCPSVCWHFATFRSGLSTLESIWMSLDQSRQNSNFHIRRKQQEYFQYQDETLKMRGSVRVLSGVDRLRPIWNWSLGVIGLFLQMDASNVLVSWVISKQKLPCRRERSKTETSTNHAFSVHKIDFRLNFIHEKVCTWRWEGSGQTGGTPEIYFETEESIAQSRRAMEFHQDFGDLKSAYLENRSIASSRWSEQMS